MWNLPQYVSPVSFPTCRQCRGSGGKDTSICALRQGSGKQSCIPASKQPCRLSLPSIVHTSKRWLIRARSALKSVEPQVAKSWAGAGEETGNQTASHLLRLQRSNSISATYCSGARMVSESPPSLTRLPVRQRHHAGSRDRASAQFQVVNSVTWDWTWDTDR